MARDSSPFSHRLKALAQRAGLPVDAPTPPAEQPTDDIPVLVPEQHVPEASQPEAPADPAPATSPQDDETWASVDDQYTGETDAIPAVAPATAFEETFASAVDEATAVHPRVDPGPAVSAPADSTLEVEPALEVEPESTTSSAEDVVVPKRSFGSRIAALRNLGPKTTAEQTDAAPVETSEQPEATATAVGTTTGAQAAVGLGPDEPFAAQEPDLPAKPTFAERAALRRRARVLRARRDAGLVELGAIVLDQRRFGDASGGSLVRRRTDELCDLEAELASLEVSLDEERPTAAVAALGILRCTSCNTLLGPADAFCAACGTPRGPVVVQEPAPESSPS